MDDDPDIKAFLTAMKSEDRLPDLELARQQEAEFRNKNLSTTGKPQKLHYVIPRHKKSMRYQESQPMVKIEDSVNNDGNTTQIQMRNYEFTES